MKNTENEADKNQNKQEENNSEMPSNLNVDTSGHNNDEDPDVSNKDGENQEEGKQNNDDKPEDSNLFLLNDADRIDCIYEVITNDTHFQDAQLNFREFAGYINYTITKFLIHDKKNPIITKFNEAVYFEPKQEYIDSDGFNKAHIRYAAHFISGQLQNVGNLDIRTFDKSKFDAMYLLIPALQSPDVIRLFQKEDIEKKRKNAIIYAKEISVDKISCIILVTEITGEGEVRSITFFPKEKCGFLKKQKASGIWTDAPLKTRFTERNSPSDETQTMSTGGSISHSSSTKDTNKMDKSNHLYLKLHHPDTREIVANYEMIGGQVVVNGKNMTFDELFAFYINETGRTIGGFYEELNKKMFDILYSEHHDAYEFCNECTKQLEGDNPNIKELSQKIIKLFEIHMQQHFREEEENAFPNLMGDNPETDKQIEDLIQEHRDFEMLIEAIKREPENKEFVTTFIEALKHHIEDEEVIFKNVMPDSYKETNNSNNNIDNQYPESHKMQDGGPVEDDVIPTPEEAAQKFVESLTDEQVEEITNKYSELKAAQLIEEEKKLNGLKEKKQKINEQKEESYEKEKTLTGEEKYKYLEIRNVYYAQLKDIDQDLLNQTNIVLALRNNGTLSEITDKADRIYPNIPNFTSIASENIIFNQETILVDKLPNYIPIIDEEAFKNRGFVFDALRVHKDTYLLAPAAFDKRYKEFFVLVTLDQLALISDYYYTKAKAIEQKKADESNEKLEASYDRLPEEKREKFLNQPNQQSLYSSLPAKDKKNITFDEWVKLTWQEKEKRHKFISHTGVKRLVSRLDSEHMWVSFHTMYEKFINPESKPPKPRYANPEVFDYWAKFRDMMNWKIKDIKIQRQVISDIRKTALETSFGESNTQTNLREKYGILVKRQNGMEIAISEIHQIEQAWININAIFPNHIETARLDNLKISHTQKTYVFASRAVGMFLPQMKTIAVSDKFGDSQFQCTFAHEDAHYIDYIVGKEKNKRHASDDYESTAGQLAFTFRKNLNLKTDSDYINATEECFARALEQYFAITQFGDEASTLYSYVELKNETPYFTADNFVSKTVFYEQIKPLVTKFFEENKLFFKYVVSLPTETTKISKTMETNIEIIPENREVEATANVWDTIPEELKKFANTKPVFFKTVPHDKGLEKIHAPFTGGDNLNPRMTLFATNFDDKGVVTTDGLSLIFTKRKQKSENGLYCFTEKCFENTNEEKELKKASFTEYKRLIPNVNSMEVNALPIDSLLLFTNTMLNSNLLGRGNYEIILKTHDNYIGFNAKLLKRALSAMKQMGHNEIEVLVSSPHRGILIVPKGNRELVADLKTDFTLVMPISLTSSVSDEYVPKNGQIYFNLSNQCVYTEGAEGKSCLNKQERDNEELRKEISKIKNETIIAKPIKKIHTKAEILDTIEGLRILAEGGKGKNKEEIVATIEGLEILAEHMGETLESGGYVLMQGNTVLEEVYK